MEKRRDVFQAIADPTRREIINLIAHQSLNLNSIANHFDSSRPTISQHVKLLEECGLLTIERQGRERYCKAKLEGLNDVAKWVNKYKVFWNSKLDALENFLENKPKHENK